MSDYLVVAADSSRARFLTLRPREVPELESGPTLTEEGAITNPEGEMSGGEVFTTTKSGQNRASGGSGADHAYDDHRSRHFGEFERRFAQQVAREIVQRARDAGARHVVVAAEKHMLGHLRPQLDGLKQGKIDCREVASEMTNLSPDEIQRHLAGKGVVPAKQGPTAGPPGTRSARI